MKLSVIMHTCRRDDPGLPSSVLGMMIDSIKRQDFVGDVELIIVDLAWEFRKDALKNVALPFPVLHIPDRPTPFRDRKILRICSPKNTGLLFARGDWVIFTDDCQVMPENGLSLCYEWARQGIGCTMAYEKRIWGKGCPDRTTGVDARGDHLGVAWGEGKRVAPRQIGFLGGTMSMIPMETALQLNGWDEMFDGSRQLEDADMCMRLTAFGQEMAYERRARVIEYEVGAYDERVVKTNPIKCNGAYSDFIWKQGGRTVANTHLLREQAVKVMNWQGCARLQDENKCSPHMSDCTRMGDKETLEAVYLDPRLVFNIHLLRNELNWGNAVDVMSVGLSASSDWPQAAPTDTQIVCSTQSSCTRMPERPEKEDAIHMSVIVAMGYTGQTNVGHPASGDEFDHLRGVADAKSNIEIVIVDRAWPNRVKRVAHALEPMLARVRYIPPRPTILMKRGYFCVSSTMNSGAVASRGELLMFVGDFLRLNGAVLDEIVKFYYDKGQLLHPVLQSSAHKVDYEEQIFCGHNSGIKVCTKKQFEATCGWEEAFDGTYGEEDVEFQQRLDLLTEHDGLVRVRRRGIDLQRSFHINGTTPVRFVPLWTEPVKHGGTNLRCNSAFNHHIVAARIANKDPVGNKPITLEEIERLKTLCSPSCKRCARADRAKQIVSYSMQDFPNIPAMLKSFAVMLGQRHGVIDPWSGLQYEWDTAFLEEMDVNFEE